VKDFDWHSGTWNCEYVAYCMFWLHVVIFRHTLPFLALCCTVVHKFSKKLEAPERWCEAGFLQRTHILEVTCELECCLVLFLVHGYWYTFLHVMWRTVIIMQQILQCSQLGNKVLEICTPLILFIIIIIFVNCNWVDTWWQWLFYMYTNMGGGSN